jgi:hypothetical protein
MPDPIISQKSSLVLLLASSYLQKEHTRRYEQNRKNEVQFKENYDIIGELIAVRTYWSDKLLEYIEGKN